MNKKAIREANVVDLLVKEVGKKGQRYPESPMTPNFPWTSSDDLLEDIVYRIEQNWNGHYNEIREAFEPLVDSIYNKLKELDEGR